LQSLLLEQPAGFSGICGINGVRLDQIVGR
jgi:hypothetical protein